MQTVNRWHWQWRRHKGGGRWQAGRLASSPHPPVRHLRSIEILLEIEVESYTPIATTFLHFYDYTTIL